MSGHNIESSQSKSVMIDDVSLLLGSVGIHSRIYPIKDDPEFNRSKDARRLSISTPSMIKLFGWPYAKGNTIGTSMPMRTNCFMY